MTFTKQDGITLLLGLLAAVAVELGVHLDNVTAASFTDGEFVRNVAVGVGTAAMRYLVTRVPELLARMRTSAP